MYLGCTVYDGILLYDEEIGYNYKLEQTNQSAVLLWFCGRILQVTGLLFLVLHAGNYRNYTYNFILVLIPFIGTLQKNKDIEKFGMLLLSIGPLINMASCLFYNTKIITEKLNIETQLSDHEQYFLYQNATMHTQLLIPVRSHNSYNMQWLCTELVELLGSYYFINS